MIRSSLVASLLLLACGRHDQPAQSGSSSAPPSAAPSAPVPAPPPVTPPPAARPAPCSVITAAEVSDIVGFAVTAHDEGYRCKFVDPKNGWLQVELMDWSSRSAQDICTYAHDKRTVVPGVGESASYLGATACVKVHEVAIVVDTSNLAADSPALHHSGAETPQIRVAKVVATRIP